MPNDPRISEWGNPMEATPSSCQAGGQPGELKHLITRRKRKQTVIAQVAASERARAQTRDVTASAGVVGPSARRPMQLAEPSGKAGRRG